MRTINVVLLNEIIKKFGGIKALSRASKVSESWLKKAKRNAYHSEPSDMTVSALTNAAKVKEEQLFPLATTKGKKTAS
jgi:hypothetical protein